MESLPDELVNKIMLYNSHPCADIIKEKRQIYSLDDKMCDEEFFDDYLWRCVVLQFESEFGCLVDDDILTLM